MLHDHSTAEQFEPFSVPPHFDFVTRCREREKRLDPAYAQRFAVLCGDGTEQSEYQTVQGMFEVMSDLFRMYWIVHGLIRVG
jgi:hypothetical protein